MFVDRSSFQTGKSRYNKKPGAPYPACERREIGTKKRKPKIGCWMRKPGNKNPRLWQRVVMGLSNPSRYGSLPTRRTSPEDVSSEKREAREAGAGPLIIAGVLLIALAVMMGWPFA